MSLRGGGRWAGAVLNVRRLWVGEPDTPLIRHAARQQSLPCQTTRHVECARVLLWLQRLGHILRGSLVVVMVKRSDCILGAFTVQVADTFSAPADRASRASV